MASGGIAPGTQTPPVFTENRIEALRNHLRVLVKALKASYVEATAAGATQRQREDANLLVDNFAKSLGRRKGIPDVGCDDGRRRVRG